MPEDDAEESDEGEGEEEFPGEVEEVVNAHAGEGCANPNHDESDGADFDEEPSPGWDEAEEGGGRKPTAEEEGSEEAADGEHGDVFCDEEGGVFEAAVFGEVTCYELAFAFGEVEGGAVGLCECSDEEDDAGGESPGGEEEPIGEEAERIVVLGLDDGGEGEGAGGEGDAEGRDDEGELVAEDLCEGAHGAEDGVFVVACPAGEEDGEFGTGGDGEVV